MSSAIPDYWQTKIRKQQQMHSWDENSEDGASFMRVESNREAVSRFRERTERNLLVRDSLLNSEPCHHIVHENQDLYPGVLFSRTHSQSPSKWDERVRRRPAPLKP